MTTMHLISHTHWDREWYCTFQEFRLRLVHLVDTLLDILSHDPNYSYFMLDGQTIVLDDYLALRPERFEELKMHTQSGRILIGPWHVLPDEFLVSSEALIRNLLQGASTTGHFGPRMHVGYTPDPFGHIAQLPQILRSFGIQDACLQRGLSDEPAELWWQSPDGSTVFLAFQRDGYGNGANIPFKDNQRALADLIQVRDTLLPHTRFGHVLIMHGTDHMEPIPETPGVIDYINQQIPGDRLVHSTIPVYLACVHAQLDQDPTVIPTVKGELRSPKRSPLLPGVLSSRMWIKQRNHTCQQILEKWAEPWSTLADQALEKIPGGSNNPSLAWIQRIDHPADILKYAWRMLMECHPHDSICGCSIDQVHAEMRPRFDQVEQVGEMITAQNLQLVAESVQTVPTDNPLLITAIPVFNPLSFPRTDLAQVTLQLPAEIDSFEIVDEQGNQQPCTITGSGSTEIVSLTLTREEVTAMASLFQSGSFGGAVLWDVKMRRTGVDVWAEVLMKNSGTPNLLVLDRIIEEMEHLLADHSLERFHIHVFTLDTVRASFIAQNVPSLGYKTYWVCPSATPQAPPVQPKLEQIGNEYYLVSVDRTDGCLTVTDLETGLIFPGQNRFVDGGDRGDEYNFNPPEDDILLSPIIVNVAVEQREGFQTLCLDLEMAVPTGLREDRHGRSNQNVLLPIHTEVRLYPKVKRIDIHTVIDNTARDHRLRVHFPAPFSTDHADYDEHFAVLSRPIGLPDYDQSWIEHPVEEKPQGAFTCLSNGTYGLTIANWGLPEIAVFNDPSGKSEAALTLLRSIGWLSRGDLSARRSDAGPSLETPGAQLPGLWSFDYAIIPHAGNWKASWQAAESFNAPFRAVSTGLHAGSLPSEHSYVSIQPSEVQITALKTAEDHLGWILRGYNRLDQPLDAHVHVFTSFEQVSLARMDETPIKAVMAGDDGSIQLPLQPNEVFTLRFK